MYSEEKGKLVRGEVEKADGAEGEARSALDGLGVMALMQELNKLKGKSNTIFIYFLFV